MRLVRVLWSVVVASVAATTVWAGVFTVRGVPGSYKFRFGSEDCPLSFTINRRAILESEERSNCKVLLDLHDFDDFNGNQLSMHLGDDKQAPDRTRSGMFKEFTIAEVHNATNCTGSKTFALEKGTVLNFFTPRTAEQLKFSEIFSKPYPKQLDASGDGDGHSSGGSSTSGGGHSDGEKSDAAAHKLLARVRQTRVGAEEAPNSTSTPSEAASNSTTRTPTPTPTPESRPCGEAGVGCEQPAASESGGGGEQNKIDLAGGDTELLNPQQRFMALGSSCMYVREADKTCFPAHATVRRRDGARVRMDALRTGDEVAVGRAQFSRVFMWTHRDAHARASFVRARTACGRALVATPSHLVHANGRLVPARALAAGDLLTRGDGQHTRVTRVDLVASTGLFNPQTLHGDIVVDDLVASTYTTAVEPPLAHALLAPLRALCEAAAHLASRLLVRDPRWSGAAAA